MNSIRLTCFLLTLLIVAPAAAQDTWIKNRWIDAGSDTIAATENANVQEHPNAQTSHVTSVNDRADSVSGKTSFTPGIEIAVSNDFQIPDQKRVVSPAIDWQGRAIRASDIALDNPEKTVPTNNFELYRDRNPYPVDPRKPCNPCVRPEQTRPVFRHSLPGFKGRPYMDSEQGGCLCGKKNCGCRKSQFSLYWPRPYSARLDERFPNRANQRYASCQQRKMVDCFDRLEDFRLINYTRQDDGHCGNFFGRNNDPYGCLGESQHFSRVYGVDYREPGEPVQRGLKSKTSRDRYFENFIRIAKRKN